MSTTTNGCAISIFGLLRLSKKTIVNVHSFPSFCILFVLVAVLNIGSANARILTKLSGTQAHVTNNVFEAFSTEVQCGDGGSEIFNYLQRMIINGKVEMVLTEFIYDVGTYDLVLTGQCNGSNIYSTGTCECISTDFDFKKTVPVIDLEAVETVNVETPLIAVSITGNIQSMISPWSAGFLWLRKNYKENLFTV